MAKNRFAPMAVLACASAASLGLLAGASPAAAKTKTMTFSQCVDAFAAIPDRPAATTPGVSYGSVALPVTVPNFKGKPQDGVVTAFNTAGVRITHTHDADLILVLISPGGQAIGLANNRGASGDGYGAGLAGCGGSLALFGDLFTTSIVTPGNVPPAPITGFLKPEQPLSTFVGGPARGNWVLIVADTEAGDFGSINALSLNFTYQYMVKAKKKKKKKKKK